MIFKSVILLALVVGGVILTAVLDSPKAPFPVFSERTIVINATSQKVWGRLADINGWSHWFKNVTKAKLNGELKPNTTFDWKASGYSIHSTLRNVVPDKELGWTGKSMTIYAVHDWKFKEVNGQTEVTVTESMGGVLARIFKKSLNKSLDTDMEESLKSLKSECEKN